MIYDSTLVVCKQALVLPVHLFGDEWPEPLLFSKEKQKQFDEIAQTFNEGLFLPY